MKILAIEDERTSEAGWSAVVIVQHWWLWEREYLVFAEPGKQIEVHGEWGVAGRYQYLSDVTTGEGFSWRFCRRVERFRAERHRRLLLGDTVLKHFAAVEAPAQASEPTPERNPWLDALEGRSTPPREPPLLATDPDWMVNAKAALEARADGMRNALAPDPLARQPAGEDYLERCHRGIREAACDRERREWARRAMNYRTGQKGRGWCG